MNNLLNKLFQKQNHVEIDNSGMLLLNFFYENKELFQTYFSDTNSNKNKKNFIKHIYGLFNYTCPTTCNKPTASDTMILYRGIYANTKEELLFFVESFSTGDVFFGKRASLFGTGIYLSKNHSEALKYATYNTNCGAVIHCLLDDNTNIIEYNNLAQLQSTLLAQLKGKYTEQFFAQYVDLLEDEGLFAAILGYDAIYIKEKEFVLILNRGKLFVQKTEIKQVHKFTYKYI